MPWKPATSFNPLLMVSLSDRVQAEILLAVPSAVGPIAFRTEEVGMNAPLGKVLIDFQFTYPVDHALELPPGFAAIIFGGCQSRL